MDMNNIIADAISTDTDDIKQDYVFQRMIREKEEVISRSEEILANQIIPDGTLFGDYSSDVFEEIVQYKNIRMDKSTDTYGRQFFRFFDEKATSLILVVFKHNHRRLVSVNNRVMPMDDFLNIVDMESLAIEKPEVSSLDIRQGLPTVNSNIVVRLLNKKEYIIKNTSVPLLMMAMTQISELFSSANVPVISNNNLNVIDNISRF
jgi:hypothetical protein